MDPINNPEGFATGMTIITIVIIAVSAIVPLGITGFVIYFIFKKLGKNKALVASGEPAQAQILSASETGTRINDQPEIAFALQVQRQGHPPYQANTTAFVSMFHLARVQVGAVVPVKVDPGNPLQVAIDMNALASTPMMQPGMAVQQAGMMAQQQQSGVACPMCRQPVQQGWRACPHCGAQIG